MCVFIFLPTLPFNVTGQVIQAIPSPLTRLFWVLSLIRPALDWLEQRPPWRRLSRDDEGSERHSCSAVTKTKPRADEARRKEMTLISFRSEFLAV